MSILQGTHSPTQIADGSGRRWLWSGVVPAPAVTTPPLEGRIALTRREEPFHPASWLRVSFQGPNVGPPTRSQWITTQESPFHPGSAVRAGVQGPNVRPPIRDQWITVQEQPFHPPAFLRASFNRRDPVPATTNRLVTVQQLPDHPLPKWLAGVYTQPIVNPVPPVTSRLSGSQEQPSHPAPSLRAGVPPAAPLFLPPISPVLAPQEQPPQFLPVLVAGVPPKLGPQTPPISVLLTKAQEILGHPVPFLWSTILPPSVIPPARVLISPYPTAQLYYNIPIASPVATVAILGTSSAHVLQPNLARRGISFYNSGNVLIYVTPDNQAAVIGQGQPIFPGDSFEILNDPIGNISVTCGWNAIAASGSTNTLTILELL